MGSNCNCKNVVCFIRWKLSKKNNKNLNKNLNKSKPKPILNINKIKKKQLYIFIYILYKDFIKNKLYRYIPIGKNTKIVANTTILI